MVTAIGRADTAAAAFHTALVSVQTHDGRDAYGTSSDVQIPASLQSIVNEVLGLQTVHTFHVLTPAHLDASSGTASAHAPTDFPTIYNAGSTATGSTINVGVVTEGSMTNVKSDFSKFLSQHTSLGSIPLNVVTVDGGSSDTAGDGEWDLDTQDIAGMAGGVKAFYLYDTSSLNTKPLVDAFNKAVTDDVVRIINVSIGGCETGTETNGAATGDNIFEQADAQGQTFSISSGDSGADECSNGGIVPSWPADSQYVVAVGGTELYTSGTTWTDETVWNNLSSKEGATGGSPSTFEPQPSWQNGVGQNAGSSYRGLPDVAFDASPESGANIIVDGSNKQYGGTSLASPLFVGVWARTLATNSSLGFAAPLIYADAASHYSTDFHDVTSGNNSGENAATGWDYATGFGSINIANFVANVAGSGGGGSTGTPVAIFTDTVNGLAVSFTNTSTDTGGKISSYSWSFGDGSTSTTVSPSHTYSAAGTYTVSLTVTDNTGATSTKSASVTVTSSGTSVQVLSNTGFETGNASPWTMSSGTLCSSNSSSSSYCDSSESPYAGTWFAWLDGYGTSHTDTVSQTVTIPSGHTTATLQYYLHIDTTKSNAVDTFTVQVLNSSGTVLATVGSFTNGNANSGYTAETANLSAYIGQTVTIKFTGKETSSSGNTDFTLDNVTLNVQ